MVCFFCNKNVYLTHRLYRGGVMIDFFDEISKMTNLPLELINQGYRYVNFAGKSLYVAGYKKIIVLSKDEVVLKLPKGRMKVVGQDMVIKDLNLSQLILVGKIISVEVC